jgi:hypothetical protein
VLDAADAYAVFILRSCRTAHHQRVERALGSGANLGLARVRMMSIAASIIAVLGLAAASRPVDVRSSEPTLGHGARPKASSHIRAV